MGISRKNKTLRASEQDKEQVKRNRQQFQKDIAAVPLNKRIYVDETDAATNMARIYGRAAIGQRVYDKAPAGYKNITTICGLRLSGVVASLAFEGGTDQQAFRTFVKECLVPVIQQGDVIIWDNLNVHEDEKVLQWIQQAGARVLPLPPYSPDFNPIEEMFSKVKGILRKLAKRTIETLYEGFAQALRCVTLQNIVGWFQHRGLCPNQT